MSNPCKHHWEAVKWILRYLQVTIEKYLCFRMGELKLQGYIDAHFAGNIDNIKNTTSYVFRLGNTSIN